MQVPGSKEFCVQICTASARVNAVQEMVLLASDDFRNLVGQGKVKFKQCLCFLFGPKWEKVNRLT